MVRNQSTVEVAQKEEEYDSGDEGDDEEDDDYDDDYKERCLHPTYVGL